MGRVARFDPPAQHLGYFARRREAGGYPPEMGCAAGDGDGEGRECFGGDDHVFLKVYVHIFSTAGNPNRGILSTRRRSSTTSVFWTIVMMCQRVG
jgi:hypothetical protein